jgi:hypothetical protein
MNPKERRAVVETMGGTMGALLHALEVRDVVQAALMMVDVQTGLGLLAQEITEIALEQKAS